MRRCGERTRLMEAMGHSFCALEALSRLSGKCFIMLHASIISYWLLLSLGWRTYPPPCLGLHYCVLGLCQMQKSLWCFFSPISLLPLQPIRLLMLLVFRDLWEALIGEPNIKRLWRKSELPRTKQEEPGISMTQTQVVEHLSRFLWKLFFYLKRRRWSTDCWDMF